MRKFLILIPLLILISSCKVSKVEKASKNAEYFKIEIVQNGKTVKDKNGIFQLEKKPFIYKLTLYKVTGIDVSNSWGKYYFDYPTEKNIYECNDYNFFKDCRFAGPKTGSEEKFNTDKNIFVGDRGYQFHWFYEESLSWHRLDKGVEIKNGITYAQVTVENIYDVDKRDSREFNETEYNYPIEKINQDIYAVFAASHFEKGMKFPIELQREKFILKFE